jgi:hypothetical protein
VSYRPVSGDNSFGAPRASRLGRVAGGGYGGVGVGGRVARATSHRAFQFRRSLDSAAPYKCPGSNGWECGRTIGPDNPGESAEYSSPGTSERLAPARERINRKVASSEGWTRPFTAQGYVPEKYEPRQGPSRTYGTDRS